MSEGSGVILNGFWVACVLRVRWSKEPARRNVLTAFSRAWRHASSERVLDGSTDYPLFEAGFRTLDASLDFALRVPRLWDQCQEQGNFRACSQCRVAIGFGALDGRNGEAFANVWPLLCAPYSGVLLSEEATYGRLPPSGIGWHKAPPAVQEMMGVPAYMPTDYRG